MLKKNKEDVYANGHDFYSLNFGRRLEYIHEKCKTE